MENGEWGAEVQIPGDQKLESGCTWEHIRSYLCCGSNDNTSVGKFVDDLKTVIINVLAYRSL
jgi:hypothetical protein